MHFYHRKYFSVVKKIVFIPNFSDHSLVIETNYPPNLKGTCNTYTHTPWVY